MADTWGMILAETVPGQQITAGCEACGWRSPVSRQPGDGDIRPAVDEAIRRLLDHILHCPVNSGT